MVGVALQVLYIALVTPGGTVSADVRAISYIGILSQSYLFILKESHWICYRCLGYSSIGAAVSGTIGTVLFYGTATTNLIWQHIGWKADSLKKLLRCWLGLSLDFPLCLLFPSTMLTKFGPDGWADELTCQWMAPIYSGLLPMCRLAILLKQIVTKATSFIPFFVGFTLAKSLGLEFGCQCSCFGDFAVIYYELEVIKSLCVTAPGWWGWLLMTMREDI